MQPTIPLKIALASALLVFCLAGAASAHTLFMTVIDNDNGTITIEGMYSTGGIAAATPVRLEDPKGKILFKGLTDEEGCLTIEKPNGSYQVILDGGPGHVASEEGPRKSKTNGE